MKDRMPPPRRHPVERFLGPDEASGGPFALLGLSPESCTDDLVLSALDRQIDRIAKHPECDTPEADEVRLALHAAAAQLLDPAVRRHLIARWSKGNAAVQEEPDSRLPSSPPTPHKLLEHDAVLALGLYGGWNQHSLRRLLSIAHARGFNNTQVAETLRALAATRRPRSEAPVAGRIQPQSVQAVSRPAAPPAPNGPDHGVESASTSSVTGPRLVNGPSGPGAQASSPEREPEAEAPSDSVLDEQTDPLPRLLLRGAAFSVVAVVIIAAVAAIVWALSIQPAAPPVVTAGDEPEQVPQQVAQAADASSEDEPATDDPDPRPRQRLDPQVLPQEIAASAAALDLDAAAATQRLINAVDALASSWPELARQEGMLVACHDGIVEFIYLAGGRDETLAAVIEAIAAGAERMGSAGEGRSLGRDQVLPAVWSAGMLSRLMREKDLPLTARLFVESRLVSAFGSASPAVDRSFRAGASAALLRVPQRLIPPPARADQPARPSRQTLDADAWSRWADAVDSFAHDDRSLRNRMLLVGLETLLIKGPEPTHSRAAGNIVAQLVTRLDWRENDESRRWLLRAFGDRLITNADLNAVTSALATRSAAEGIDLTMVLSASAADRVRADLRERYAAVWNITDLISREETTLAWIQAAHILLEEEQNPETEAQQLARAALFARLNEAAQWQWRGEQDEAAIIIGDLRRPVDAAIGPPPTGVGEQTIYRSASWAERYLAVRQSIRGRRELLSELARMHGELGDVDAAVLVQEATAGSPPELRLQAIELVRQFGSSPAVINAMLDRLPRMPRLPANSQLIEHLTGRSLPPVRDETWPLEARRALVQRLVSAIATGGHRAQVDAVAELLASSYQAMGTTLPLAGGGSAGTDPYAAARQLWSTWRATAEPLIPSVSPPFSLSQIERRRTGRLAHARGPIQLFAAEQVSICEILAYIVTCERPGHAEDIRGIMHDLAAERRRANHIFDQLIAVERAITRLWLIRIEAEEPT